MPGPVVLRLGVVNPLRTVRYKLKELYHLIIKEDHTPEELARGVGIGVFWGLSALYGFHMIGALLTAIPLRANKIMAPLVTWIMNPFTILPLFLMNYRVGQVIFYPNLSTTFSEADLKNLKSIVHVGWDFFIVSLLGSVVMGLLFGFVAYIISKPLCVYLRR